MKGKYGSLAALGISEKMVEAVGVGLLASIDKT
jgi:hypothetical protein